MQYHSHTIEIIAADFIVLTFIIKTEHMRKEDQLMEAYDAPNIEVIEVEVEQVLASSMQYEDWD